MVWYSRKEIRETREEAMRWGQLFGELLGSSRLAAQSLDEEGRRKVLEEVLASCHGNYQFQAGTSFPCMLWDRIKEFYDSEIAEWAQKMLETYNQNLMAIGNHLGKDEIKLVAIDRFPGYQRKFSYKNDAGKHYHEVLECIDSLDLITGKRKLSPQ